VCVGLGCRGPECVFACFLRGDLAVLGANGDGAPPQAHIHLNLRGPPSGSPPTKFEGFVTVCNRRFQILDHLFGASLRGAHSGAALCSVAGAAAPPVSHRRNHTPALLLVSHLYSTTCSTAWTRPRMHIRSSRRRGPGTRVETERSCVARGAHARAQARHTGHAPHRCRQDTPRQHSGRRATRRGHAST